MANLGQPLPSPPGDGITSLNFIGNTSCVLASSWDQAVRIYDTVTQQQRYMQYSKSALLDSAPQHEAACFSAGVDGVVRRHDFARGAEDFIGQHDKGAKSLQWINERGLLVSGGWDSTVRVWDPRAPPGSNCVALIPVEGKVFSMSQSQDRLVVATSTRQVIVFNKHRIEQPPPEQQRESALKYQTRCVACYPDGTGFAVGSVEGRVAIEYFDMDPAVQAQKYAFKCHRTQRNGQEVVTPVNCMAFHASYGTFVTGGCEGGVAFWDGKAKKRLQYVTGYPSSISAVAFDASGTRLAIASSYTWEEGEKNHPADAIFIRPVVDAEVRPKPRIPTA